MLKNFIFYDEVFVICGKIVIGVDANGNQNRIFISYKR